ncbi:MAG: glycosyltransferase [Methylococcales bacterium]
MKLINETKKPITILYQGKRTIIYPGQIIEGPNQLTAYGLTPIKVRVDGGVASDISTVEQKVKLLNRKNKPITILYQGKRTVVFPDQIIEGPIHFTIYGLTPVKTINENEVDKTIKFVKTYNKEKLPSVAICILTKDSPDLISDCINSIEQHVIYPNTEIYLFDTGTTDKQTLDYYAQKIISCKFSVNIVSVGDFHFSKNYNDGLKTVTTDYYLMQNNDTVALTDYVSGLMKLAIVNKVGACGPRMLYKDGSIQHDGQVLYHHQAKGFSSPTHVNLGRNPCGVSTGRQPADGITCAGMLVRSSVYWEAGGLNEKYHDIFQDVELNIKIRMNGHAIICDRDALIYHYDHTSRNHFYEQNIEKIHLMDLDTNYLFGKLNNELRYTERFKKTFSIVTLVSNEKIYLEFLNDIKNQDCNFDYEIIALPNFNNEYSSCAEALNIGLDVAEGEYVLMTHQDLRVPKNWFKNIMDHIKLLIANDVRFGVLGMAGSWVNDSGEGRVIYLTENENAHIGTPFENFTYVQCLDELCLIVKRNNEIRFDEATCDGYYCYGTDLCLNYLSHGYRNVAINAPCTYPSEGYINISDIEKLNKYTSSTLKLFKKWRGTVPVFRNTTAKFSAIDNSVNFYNATELNKRGIPLNPVVILDD